MKKSVLIIIILVVAIGIFAYFKLPKQGVLPSNEITFYYLDQCEWCNKAKSEGTLEKIEALGIKVNRINAATGPVNHKFSGVPTFVINNKVYEGYMTFEEIKKIIEEQLPQYDK